MYSHTTPAIGHCMSVHDCYIQVKSTRHHLWYHAVLPEGATLWQYREHNTYPLTNPPGNLRMVFCTTVILQSSPTGTGSAVYTTASLWLPRFSGVTLSATEHSSENLTTIPCFEVLNGAGRGLQLARLEYEEAIGKIALAETEDTALRQLSVRHAMGILRSGAHAWIAICTWKWAPRQARSTSIMTVAVSAQSGLVIFVPRLLAKLCRCQPAEIAKRESRC